MYVSVPLFQMVFGRCTVKIFLWSQFRFWFPVLSL